MLCNSYEQLSVIDIILSPPADFGAAEAATAATLPADVLGSLSPEEVACCFTVGGAPAAAAAAAAAAADASLVLRAETAVACRRWRAAFAAVKPPPPPPPRPYSLRRSNVQPLSREMPTAGGTRKRSALRHPFSTRKSTTSAEPTTAG